MGKTSKIAQQIFTEKTHFQICALSYRPQGTHRKSFTWVNNCIPSAIQSIKVALKFYNIRQGVFPCGAMKLAILATFRFFEPEILKYPPISVKFGTSVGGISSAVPSFTLIRESWNFKIACWVILLPAAASARPVTTKNSSIPLTGERHCC